MRIRHYIIPIALYLICLPIGWFMSFAHQRAIADAINQAGKQGKPLIVVAMDRRVMFGRERVTELWLITYDGEYIKILEEIIDTSIVCVFFRPDGTLYIQNNYGYLGLWELQLPKNKLVPVPLYKPELIQCDERFVGSGIHWNHFRTLRVFEHFFDIYDPLLGTHREHRFVSQTPWELTDQPKADSYIFALSHDESTIFLLERFIDSSVQPSRIWRYETENDIWVELTQVIGDIATIQTSPNGDYIAVHFIDRNTQRSSVSFFNAIDGSLIKDVSDSFSMALGQKWTACVIIIRGGSENLLLYDIGNSILSRRIGLPGKNYLNVSYTSGMLAIYEPPPNGLDGMYEKYVGDGDGSR